MTMETVSHLQDQQAPEHRCPDHHLSDELLSDYAAGTCDEAVSLFVATHLTYCPLCRGTLSSIEAMAGSLIEGLEPSELSDHALDAMLQRLDAEETISTDPCLAPSPCQRDRAMAVPSRPELARLPSVLQGYIAQSMTDGFWQSVGMGVEIHELETLGPSKAILLRVPAGRAVPQHTHKGNEYVMVLEGAYEDDMGRFARGDVEIADDTVQHQPMATMDRDCICLAVTDGPLQLTGLFGRLLNPFVKI